MVRVVETRGRWDKFQPCGIIPAAGRRGQVHGDDLPVADQMEPGGLHGGGCGEVEEKLAGAADPRVVHRDDEVAGFHLRRRQAVSEPRRSRPRRASPASAPGTDKSRTWMPSACKTCSGSWVRPWPVGVDGILGGSGVRPAFGDDGFQFSDLPLRQMLRVSDFAHLGPLDEREELGGG